MKKNENINQLRIGVILSYLSTGLQMIISLTYTPFMIRLLGQSEYGLYTLVGSFVSYLSLFSLGFTGSYLRFFSRYKAAMDNDGEARLNGLFLTLFLLMSAAALVTGMILAQFTPQIFGSKLTEAELKTAKILLEILVINIALTFPSSVMNSIISAHEQFLWQRVINLISIITHPFICLPLLFMGKGSIMLVTVTTITTLTTLLLNTWFCLKKVKASFKFGNYERGLMKEIGNFSFFIFLNMIIDRINWSVDQFILGRVAGTASVAVYGVGGNINSMFTQFSISISSVFSPRVNLIAAKEEKNIKESFTTIFIKVGRLQYIVLGLIASGFIIFGYYFITELYAGATYGESYIVVLLLILPVMIPLIQNLGIEIQRAVNKHQFRAIAYLIMALINIAISIPFAIKWGAKGAALGTTISLLVANGLMMNIYYHKVIGINIIEFWKNIISVSKGLIIPIIIGFIILKYIKIENAVLFVSLILLYSAIYIVSMYLFGMNEYERDLIKKPIKRLLRRQ